MLVRFLFVAPLLLAVAGSVVYHIGAKSIPQAYDPIAALIGLYATALAGSVLVYAVKRVGLSSAASPMWHPTIAAVGLGALMIEMGFLLAYRAMWPVSTTSVITNGVAAVMLVSVGSLWFGEPFTGAKTMGVLLVLAGVTLLQR
jgi:multidrug transporter EmrE-like cation transporter